MCWKVHSMLGPVSPLKENAMHKQKLIIGAPTSMWKIVSRLLPLAAMCLALQAQMPPTTTVSDTVFRADGTPAGGTLLISWPPFTTSTGTAIAGGTKSVTLGTGGSLSVALVPNAGATPASTVYTVVYQLTDGTVKTEYWIVSNASPTSLAAVRTSLGSGGNATSLASRNYVETAIGTALSGVAHLDSNGDVSENANTATQLATTPSQCNGAFATGIQPNGNANCSTADIIQLAETTAPTGISNFGIFWFDSTCHCPRVISNDGSPIQVGLVNLFNTDTNTLEQRNGTSRQIFNFYGTYTNSTDFERLGLTYDTVSGNFVFKARQALLAVRFMESDWVQEHRCAGGFRPRRRSGGVLMLIILMTWEMSLIASEQAISAPASF